MSEATIEETQTPVGRAERAVDDFDAFVTARWDSLWRSAWLLCGDRHRAEDLVQTALGKCWPQWERVNENGSFDAYVRRALFTTYLAWWRKRSWGELPSELPDRAVSTPEAESSRPDLLAALAGLPPGQRAVVVLRYFEDRTETDTARVLGCSLGTVKSQHARALRTLRQSDLLQDGDRP